MINEENTSIILFFFYFEQYFLKFQMDVNKSGCTIDLSWNKIFCRKEFFQKKEIMSQTSLEWMSGFSLDLDFWREKVEVILWYTEREAFFQVDVTPRLLLKKLKNRTKRGLCNRICSFALFLPTAFFYLFELSCLLQNLNPMKK